MSSRLILPGAVDCQAQGALVCQLLQLLYHGIFLERAAEGAAGGKSHFRLPAACNLPSEHLLLFRLVKLGGAPLSKWLVLAVSTIAAIDCSARSSMLFPVLYDDLML